MRSASGRRPELVWLAIVQLQHVPTAQKNPQAVAHLQQANVAVNPSPMHRPLNDSRILTVGSCRPGQRARDHIHPRPKKYLRVVEYFSCTHGPIVPCAPSNT